MTAKKRALVMVDLQNDFCLGGSLAVPDGEAVMPMANKLQSYFDVLVATKDWHPQDHTSFAVNHPGRQIGEMVTVHGIAQVLWPAHCVQHSQGSEFHPQFVTDEVQKIIHKGTDKNIDSYSAFFDNEHRRATGLADYLRGEGVEDVYVMGLATDYCVKYSCLDAVHLGFSVHVIVDACRGVELQAGDVTRALEEMSHAGVKMMTMHDIVAGGHTNKRFSPAQKLNTIGA